MSLWHMQKSVLCRRILVRGTHNECHLSTRANSCNALKCHFFISDALHVTKVSLLHFRRASCHQSVTSSSQTRSMSPKCHFFISDALRVTKVSLLHFSALRVTKMSLLHFRHAPCHQSVTSSFQCAPCHQNVTSSFQTRSVSPKCHFFISDALRVTKVSLLHFRGT
jgi:hypothetical protein